MTDDSPATKRPGPLRRLYDWVLSWAYTPYGSPALCVLSFAESSFFPIPPDVLLVPLTLSRRERWMHYAGLCTTASVLGGLLGYTIGAFFWTEWEGLRDLVFAIPGASPEGFDRVQELYREQDVLIVFAAGFTPLPYKLITITAGVFRLDLPLFILASAVGRGGRFFLVAWLVRHFGPPVQPFIDRWFNWLCVAFLVLLVAGFLAVENLF